MTAVSMVSPEHHALHCNAPVFASVSDYDLAGDEDEQERQVQLAESFKPESFWRAHGKDLNTIASAARAQRLLKETAAAPGEALPTTNDEQSALDEDISKTSGLDRKAMEQERLARLNAKRKREPSPELELFNPLQGRPEAWQLGEPVDDFIKRLPPLTTSISTCPWIWAMNPHRNPRGKSPSPREDDFTTRGMQLLAQSSETRRKIQERGAKGPRAAVTRQLIQESKALQGRIASLAKKTHVLSGKVGLSIFAFSHN